MIKLVAIDLDGTLLTNAKEISIENKRALMQAKDNGVKVVLCTGRPLASMTHYLEELALIESGQYSITFNGGLVQKNDSGEIIEKKALTFQEVEKLYQLAKLLAIPLDILSDDQVLQLPTAPNRLSIYSQLNTTLDFYTKQLADVKKYNVLNKAVVAYEKEYLDQQIKQIPKNFYETFEVIKTRENLLEFMPKGVTKAYGISLLAKDLSLEPAEIMAIGDEENDLPMIEYAGIGVAMSNAVKQVKAAADYITTSNEEHGVAHAIQKFILS